MVADSQPEAQYEEQKRLQQEKAQQEAEAAKQKQLEAEKLRQQEEAEKQKQLFKHQISPKPLMGNLAGPPPVVDDFECVNASFSELTVSSKI